MSTKITRKHLELMYSYFQNIDMKDVTTKGGFDKSKMLSEMRKVLNEDLIERIERIPTKQVDSPVNFHIRNYARSDEYIPKKYVLDAIR